MKNYKFNQVRKALENRGFYPVRGFGDEWSVTTVFEKSSGTQFGFEFVQVEEWLMENGKCTIDGLNPKKWAKINL